MNNAPQSDAGDLPGEELRLSTRRNYLKLGVLLLLIAGVVIASIAFRDQLSLSKLAEYKRTLDEYVDAWPVLVFGGAFVVYVLTTGFSLPGATILSLLFGAVFGFVPAVILVSFASTAGATLAFLLSRYLARDWVQRRFAGQLSRANAALEREGAFYLFTLRLLPVVPFFVINLVMGLTPLRVRTFWWVSQLGMFPATCIYVFAGSSIEIDQLAAGGISGIFTWKVTLALALLGVSPLAFKYGLRAWRRRRQDPQP